MFKVLTLAKTTLREMLRERVFLVVVVIAVILFALSFLLGALSLAEQRKILADFGFLGIQVALLGVSLFSGAYLLAKEIEKQTCLLILSRPVTRDQFILGKIFGVLALNVILVTSLGILLALLLGLWNEPQRWGTFFEICLSLWMESAVLLCLVIGLSLVVRPVLALSSGFVIFLLGHWLSDLAFFAEKSKEAIFVTAVKALHWVVPNLYRLNWKSDYFLENGIPFANILWMLGHMLGWFLIYLVFTNFFFRRKDIV
ncbi:ABC transporter permease [Bdellovibrio svalbardensis]|uniref:ABC transporter permease n=1 Tax=Bdellovibrio svalbardensis TaxID=2972972 RepID=A0ABT6DLD8_9BACT|nr:ABC transporter permease [Bdellovibrio svalbardensis]MDG0816724.1 ABC transporter permease [Bdellovibrio svalbardensis]